MPLDSQGRLNFVNEAGKILSSSLQAKANLQRLADLISSTIADVCAIDLFRDDGSRDRVAIAFPKGLLNVETVISGGATQPDPVFLIPLPIDGGTLGVITLVRLGRRMESDDLSLVEDVARLAALSVENARLYQRAQDALLTVRNQAANIRRMNEDLERRVVERTLELEAANRGMAVVNYTVSHDLRAPLRAIQAYSQMLMEDFADDLPEGAKSYVGKLISSTKDINQLLDGLLNHCKLSAHQLNRKIVSLNDIVKDSLETLQPRVEGRQIEFVVDRLDEIYADPILIKQVFVNLLSNAITYTSPRDKAVIEVGQMQEPGALETIFYVKDNGVGFDGQDKEKLFQPFRRLHAAAGFEGTGVGLSIVSGIIKRHGGRIWAKGTPGAGATFYFTLGQQNRERLAS